MTEPTIICPNCKTEIKLTESLAAPLIEATPRQFEQKVAQKDNVMFRGEGNQYALYRPVLEGIDHG